MTLSSFNLEVEEWLGEETRGQVKGGRERGWMEKPAEQGTGEMVGGNDYRRTR